MLEGRGCRLLVDGGKRGEMREGIKAISNLRRTSGGLRERLELAPLGAGIQVKELYLFFLTLDSANEELTERYTPKFA